MYVYQRYFSFDLPNVIADRTGSDPPEYNFSFGRDAMVPSLVKIVREHGFVLMALPTRTDEREIEATAFDYCSNMSNRLVIG